MKNVSKFKNHLLFISTLLCTVFLSSCNGDKSHHGQILTDKRTGKNYLLEHRTGDTYFIWEEQMVIVGSDTTYMFNK